MDVIDQLQVTQHDGTAANGAMRANSGAARNTRATGHGGVFADPHVVRDLYQVVELDAVFQNGVLQRATVNAGVGANLDVIADLDRAQLLNFDPLAVMRRKAKPVSTDHYA